MELIVFTTDKHIKNILQETEKATTEAEERDAKTKCLAFTWYQGTKSAHVPGHENTN